MPQEMDRSQQEKPLSQVIPQSVGNPEPPLLDIAEPASGKTSVLDLINRIFSLIRTANTYVVAIVLWLLVFSLILVVAFVHRIANRILMLLNATPQRPNHQQRPVLNQA